MQYSESHDSQRIVQPSHINLTQQKSSQVFMHRLHMLLLHPTHTQILKGFTQKDRPQW